METLLTEIISFSGTAKGIPAYAAGTQLHLYFSMLPNAYRGFSWMKTNLHHGGTETRRRQLKIVLLLCRAFT